MNKSGPSELKETPVALDDDSAVTVLLHLDSERGKMFTEQDYREMRTAVLDEIAHGARIRPFTLFTFGFILLGLAGVLVLGVVTFKETRDHTLTIVSGVALIAAAYFFWNVLRGVKNDTFRSIDSRLEELNQLRQHHLVSDEEFNEIQAHILMARQRAT